MGPLDPGPDGENVDGLIEVDARLAALGITHYHGSVPDAGLDPADRAAGRARGPRRRRLVGKLNPPSPSIGCSGLPIDPVRVCLRA